MSEKTLKFNNIIVNKKEFHKSKQPIDLSLVIVDRIVIPDKFKHSDNAFKYFLGYQKCEIVKSLCIILPQMTGYIKYFENGEKNLYLEECKYRVKKIQMSRLINAELESDSDSKLDSGPDSDSGYHKIKIWF